MKHRRRPLDTTSPRSPRRGESASDRPSAQQEAADAEQIVRHAHTASLTPEEAADHLGLPLRESAWAQAVDAWAGLFAETAHEEALLAKRRTALRLMRLIRRFATPGVMMDLRLAGRVVAGTAVPASPVLLTANAPDPKAALAALLSLGLDPAPIPPGMRVPEPGFGPDAQTGPRSSGVTFDFEEERFILKLCAPGESRGTALPASVRFSLPAPSGNLTEAALEAVPPIRRRMSDGLAHQRHPKRPIRAINLTPPAKSRPLEAPPTSRPLLCERNSRQFQMFSKEIGTCWCFFLKITALAPTSPTPRDSGHT